MDLSSCDSKSGIPCLQFVAALDEGATMVEYDVVVVDKSNQFVHGLFVKNIGWASHCFEKFHHSSGHNGKPRQ